MASARDVVDALLRKQTPVRVGFMDSPWADTLRAWVPQGYPADDKGNPVAPVEHFDFDLVGCGGWFDWQPLMGVSELVEETDEWAVHRNGAGAALKYWKAKSGTPEHIDFRMTDREVWGRDYRPHLVGSADKRVTDQVLDNTRKALEHHRGKGRWAHYGHMFIWECMRASLGDVCLYESMVLDPGWIRDYCRVTTDLFTECFRRLIETAGKPDGIWLYEDLGYRDRTFCSPAVYRDVIFPFYAEMVALFHGYDLPVVLHTCGFTESILDLIVEAGFDGLNPMEVKAGNRPLWIAEHYGDRLCLIGGLDERILESGDRDLIRKGVTEIVEGMKARGARYVYASDHSISTNVTYDSFRFAVDVYREHMWY
jgi:uroporphyrinogen decarboxylase